MRMATLAIFSLALTAALLAGGTPPPVEGESRYPSIKAQQTWEQMEKRWAAAALSVYGTLGDVRKMTSQVFPERTATGSEDATRAK